MISGIHIASSQVVIKKDFGSSKQSLPEFQNNQIVKAKVLQLMPNGKTLILINNHKIMAKTAMLLKPGEQIQLKVLSQKDVTVLKLINPVQQMTTRQISSLVSLFVKNSSSLDITESKVLNIKKLINEISLKSEKSDKLFLPRLIDKSGISLENKIANILSETKSELNTNTNTKINIKTILNNLLTQDVKGNILQTLLSSDSQNSPITASMKTAASFLETMENFQLLNHQSSDSGRFLLPFPIFSDSAFSFGQLLIDTGDKNKTQNKDGEKLIKLSFLLNMTKLGTLRADFSILKKDITGRFLLQDDEICEYVKSMIPELKQKLENIEYHAFNIECKTAKKEEIQPGAFIETLLNAGEDRVLNVVA